MMRSVVALVLTATAAVELTPETWDAAVAGKTTILVPPLSSSLSRATLVD